MFKIPDFLLRVLDGPAAKVSELVDQSWPLVPSARGWDGGGGGEMPERDSNWEPAH